MMRNVNLYPASLMTTAGTKWGYVDHLGRFVIPPQFDSTEYFQDNGLAIVRLNDRAGIIDLQGRWVVEPEYSFISDFSEGRANVGDSSYTVIDERGQVLTTKAYACIGSYHDGRAMFGDSAGQGEFLYGYLDREGKELIPLRFQSAEEFVQGKAVVRIRENEHALIGLGGEVLARYNYAFAGRLSEGLMVFRQNVSYQGPYGYIDEGGIVILPPQYTSAESFHEGRAIVNISSERTSKYGLIDTNGTFMIEPIYNSILYLGEGRFAVGKAIDGQKPLLGSRYAIAGLNGKMYTSFNFTNVEPFQDGLASATDGRKTFFIDKQGEIAANLPVVNGVGTLTFVGALISAFVDERISYYTFDSRLVWQQNDIIPLNNQFRIKEQKYKPNKDYLVYYPQVEGMVNPVTQRRVNKQLAELSLVVPVSGGQLDEAYSSNFAVRLFRKQLLVVELSGYRYPFGAAHGMPSKVYPHADLDTGSFYQLEDLFKPDSGYVQVLGDIIADKIKNDPEYSYIDPVGYEGIKPDQPFYVSDEVLNIYFLPYEISAFAAGFPNFRIPFADIINIIDVQGAFWESFH